ncbi:MAG: dephospho-CoA kinase [Bacteroidales bacterium]|nr:dephospho-CoA kinase [Bacteroidales bacterium]
MRTLAITGGIGSGKSYVCNIFAAMGVPVYNADRIQKELYASDPYLRNALEGMFGEGVFEEGRLNAKLIASRIFNDDNAREALERVAYPALMRDFRRWKEEQQGRAPFVLFESALLLEKKEIASLADKILCVVAPMELRIRRVMSRDGATEEQVAERINCQWDDQKRVELSDWVICSNGARALLPQCVDIYNKMANTEQKL